MNVHGGDGIFHGSQNIAIVKGREFVGQPALDANFSRSQLPSLDSLLGELFEAEEVRITFARTTAEGTEFAANETHIGEIDVAIDDVGNKISDQIPAQGVGGDEQAEQVVAFDVGQQQALFSREMAAVLGFQNLIEGGASFKGNARNNVGPLQRREALQFGLGQGSDHRVSSTILSTKQVGGGGTNQVAGAS